MMLWTAKLLVACGLRFLAILKTGWCMKWKREEVESCEGSAHDGHKYESQDRVWIRDGQDKGSVLDKVSSSLDARILSREL